MIDTSHAAHQLPKSKRETLQNSASQELRIKKRLRPVQRAHVKKVWSPSVERSNIGLV